MGMYRIGSLLRRWKSVQRSSPPPWNHTTLTSQLVLLPEEMVLRVGDDVLEGLLARECGVVPRWW
jgi:hypothetical protein